MFGKGRRKGWDPASAAAGASQDTPEVAAVRAAVSAVQDPELHKGLGELGMVNSVRLDPDGVALVTIDLTTPGCPMTTRIRTDVTEAVTGLPGVSAVQVDFGAMSEEQRRAAARTALAGVPRRDSPAPVVYAVASGKGGVGKSSVSANLAVALAQQGKSVGLLDADVWGYSVPQLFGVDRRPIAMYEKMLPVEQHGVKLMSLGFLVDEGTPIVWRGPMLEKALQQFIHDVHWGELDVLVLDLPPGTGDVTISLLEMLPDAILVAVTTPQKAAVTVAKRVGAMAQEAGMPIAGVIENMSGAVCEHCGGTTAVFGAGGGAELATELGVPLLAQVPLDTALRDAGDRGTPVVLASPASASAQALTAAAAALQPVRRSLVGRQLGLTPV